MNRFLVFVTGSPFNSVNGQTALSFCEAAVALGHHVDQVFFYQQGVQQANSDIQNSSGEKLIIKQWADFSEQTKTPLNICVTASIKRGVIAQDDATQLQLACNVHSAFSAVGMADYFSALSMTDGEASSPVCIQF